MKTKIIGISLMSLISLIFLVVACVPVPSPITITSDEVGKDYLWKRVQIEITPIKQLEDGYISHVSYPTSRYDYYHVYDTQEGILVLVEKPNELFLEKTVKVIGEIGIYWKKPGSYVLIISLFDFKEAEKDRH